MVCFWRCSQNHSFQQWIKQIIQLSINIWLIDIPKSNMHQNRLNSAVLLKTALFSLKSFYLIHVLFFWQNSTTNYVFYPMVWLKEARSLYLMFTKFQTFQVLYLGPKIFFCPNLICTGLKIFSSTVCKDSAKYRGGTYSCSKPSITASIKSHTTWTLPYACLSVSITANLAVALRLT